ncbi:MAG: type II toxin-antitoxin system HicA family toxin [Chloroflexota bacterium]
MSKKRKLLKKALSGSKNFHFDDLILLLEAFGFVLKRISGSHHIYKHPSVPDLLSIQPAENGQAKPYQIRQFLKLTEEYNLNFEEDNSEIDEDEEA